MNNSQSLWQYQNSSPISFASNWPFYPPQIPCYCPGFTPCPCIQPQVPAQGLWLPTGPSPYCNCYAESTSHSYPFLPYPPYAYAKPSNFRHVQQPSSLRQENSGVPSDCSCGISYIDREANETSQDWAPADRHFKSDTINGEPISAEGFGLASVEAGLHFAASSSEHVQGDHKLNVEESFGAQLPAHEGDDNRNSWPTGKGSDVSVEGKDEDEDEVDMEMTEEWVQFFRESEARRQEKKRQQKREAKQARKVIRRKGDSCELRGDSACGGEDQLRAEQETA